MTAPSRVSVILPCLDERENAIGIVRRLLAVVPAPREIVVVDDDSADGTAAALGLEFMGNPDVRVIVRRGEKGLASALRRGLSASSGDIVAWMDCDWSMPPETLAELVGAVRRGSCDAAVGSRFAKGGRDGRRGQRSRFGLQAWLSAFLSGVIMLLLRSRFSDWTSGFIAVRRQALPEGGLRGRHGEYFIRLIRSLLARGCRVVEVPYEYAPRRRGASKTAGSMAMLLTRGLGYVGAVAGLVSEEA